FLVYLVAIPAAILLIRRRSSDARHAYAVAAVLILAATTSAFAVGRTGPGSALTVRYGAIVHQFPGSARSIVLMRGSIEYPDVALFEIRAPLADGGFETSGPRGVRDDQRYDAGGSPVLRGRFSLGARKAFALEGVADLQAVDVSRRGAVWHVSNISNRALDECTVMVGGADRSVGTLAAGSSLDIAGAATNEAATLSCLLPASALPFTEAQHRVVTEGRLQLAVHLPAAPGRS